MTRIIYVEPSGKRHELDVANGESVMKAAMNSGVPGITADCGGACACATCHVYVDEDFLSRMPPRSEMEDEMLEGVASDRLSTSRLSCQVIVDDTCEGLVVHIPDRQF